MKIIISNTSQVPIYEQIIRQVKDQIIKGELSPGEGLPSVRNLASTLRISALTVKKAYDGLEKEGFVVTVQGKGSFVSSLGGEIISEQSKRAVELSMEETVRLARLAHMSKEEVKQLVDIIMEE